MIVLINLNSYLGGGETLFVRFAEYMFRNNFLFKLIYLKNSYICDDIHRLNIPETLTINIDSNNENFYYLNDNERKNLVTYIANNTKYDEQITYVTFCMRDLFTITQVSKLNKNAKIVHLSLHYQDNLYVSQSLFDKILRKYLNKERFSRKSQIKFNGNLLNMLCDNNAVIPMGDFMVEYWNKKFNIKLAKENVALVPTIDAKPAVSNLIKNKNKIIWIGRIVDFKIPGLCAMLNYVNKNKKYSLTIVGDGNIKYINHYIKKKKIDTNRIHYIGQVPYDKLESIIIQHSIGYAMGTSLIEICKYRIPTIMGLATPKHKLFKKDICGGLFSNVSRGNVGDNLFIGQSEKDQPLIEFTMEQIENNYEKYAQNCYDYVMREYDFNTNIKRYLSLIEHSSITSFCSLNIPKSSFIRKLFFKYY